MLFKLLHISKNWNEAIDYEADSIEAACEYVLKNSFKFSNYRLLVSDTVQVCYKTIDGDWFIAAFVDLYKNEIWIQHYHWDDRRPPEPYVENASDDSEEKNAEQGESVDVENSSASEQDNTVENTSKKTKLFLILKKAYRFSLYVLLVYFSFSSLRTASDLLTIKEPLDPEIFRSGGVFAFASLTWIFISIDLICSFIRWLNQLKAVKHIKNRLPHYRKGGRK